MGVFYLMSRQIYSVVLLRSHRNKLGWTKDLPSPGGFVPHQAQPIPPPLTHTVGPKHPSTDSFPLGARSALLRTRLWQGPAPTSSGTGPSYLSINKSYLLYRLWQPSFIHIYRAVYDSVSEVSNTIAQQWEFTCLRGLPEFTGIWMLITIPYSCGSRVPSNSRQMFTRS